MNRIVHCKKEKFDIYIGRQTQPFHYGNPWSHREKSLGIQVETREIAISNFRKWITGTDFTEIDPRRRDWIIRHLPDLKEKVLGCWCSPAACHGEVLIEMIANL